MRESRARRAPGVKTKSVYAPKGGADGVRILVTRFYPRGVKRAHFDRWMRDLAPSAELLRGYKSGRTGWPQFCAAFRAELRGRAALLQDLHSESAGKALTLLCYEPDGQRCHRDLLREIISDPSLLDSDFEALHED